MAAKARVTNAGTKLWTGVCVFTSGLGFPPGASPPLEMLTAGMYSANEMFHHVAIQPGQSRMLTIDAGLTFTRLPPNHPTGRISCFKIPKVPQNPVLVGRFHEGRPITTIGPRR